MLAGVFVQIHINYDRTLIKLFENSSFSELKVDVKATKIQYIDENYVIHLQNYLTSFTPYFCPTSYLSTRPQLQLCILKTSEVNWQWSIPVSSALTRSRLCCGSCEFWQLASSTLCWDDVAWQQATSAGQGRSRCELIFYVSVRLAFAVEQPRLEYLKM